MADFGFRFPGNEFRGDCESELREDAANISKSIGRRSPKWAKFEYECEPAMFQILQSKIRRMMSIRYPGASCESKFESERFTVIQVSRYDICVRRVAIVLYESEIRFKVGAYYWAKIRRARSIRCRVEGATACIESAMFTVSWVLRFETRVRVRSSSTAAGVPVSRCEVQNRNLRARENKLVVRVLGSVLNPTSKVPNSIFKVDGPNFQVHYNMRRQATNLRVPMYEVLNKIESEVSVSKSLGSRFPTSPR